MDFEDILELVFILIIGSRWLKNLVGGFRRDAEDEQDEPAPLPAEASAEPVHVTPHGHAEVDDPAFAAARSLERLEALGQRARLLLARAHNLLQEGAGDPAFAPLRQALQGPMIAGLEEVRGLTEQTGVEVRSKAGPVMIDPESLFSVEAALNLSTERLAHLEAWWRQRNDAGARATLGDADALARALLARPWEFLHTRGIEVVDPLPFCAFAEHGLAYSLMFRGTGAAPLLLPRSYAYDVASWPILAHEIGHVIVANVPGLDADVSEAIGEQLLIPTWASEVFADGIGTMLLGPAFVRAAARDLASPDSPLEVVAAAQDDYGEPTEHPPSHLRIRFATALLAEMGLRDDAERIWREWEELHDEPDAIFLPRGDGAYGGYELQPFLDGFSRAAITLGRAPMRSLSEYALTSIPGLVFTKRENHAVQDQVEAFRAGLPRRADPRAVVAAAVLLGLEDESLHAERLADLVKQSIRGIGTDEPRHAPAHPSRRTAAPRRRRSARVDRRTELIEGMILAESVLSRPLALRRR